MNWQYTFLFTATASLAMHPPRLNELPRQFVRGGEPLMNYPG